MTSSSPPAGGRSPGRPHGENLLQRLASGRARRPLSAEERKQVQQGRVSNMLATIIATIYLLGLLAIVIYSLASSGRHFQYVAVGVLAALAATLAGSFFGFLVGIPRQVSLGSVRQDASLKARVTDSSQSDHDHVDEAKDEVGAADTSHTPATAHALAARFSQSTNLAEISDWLTKLLLGAGLVSLGKLGKPLGALITKVAGGLTSANPVSSSAKVMAGNILIAYTVLGFMVAYVVTTSWYRGILEAQ